MLKKALPINAILFCVAIQLILATINIGPSVAFATFLGLAILGLNTVFAIAALVMLHTRLTTENMRWGSFRLDRAGVPITLFALAYTLIGFFFAAWPTTLDPSVETFNWGLVVYLAVVLIATAWRFIKARHVYPDQS